MEAVYAHSHSPIANPRMTSLVLVRLTSLQGSNFLTYVNGLPHESFDSFATKKMQRRYRTTRLYRFWRATHREHGEALNDLLHGIWGFQSIAKVEQPTVYRTHYHGIRATVNTYHVKFTSLHDVIFLVRLMREERHQSLNHIKEKIRDSLPKG